MSGPPHEAAFRALYHAEFDYVWGALRRLGVRSADLEDVAHEVFLRVYKRFEEFDADRPIRPWLYAFAFRTAADYRKSARHRREQLEDVPDAVDDRSSPEMALDRARETERTRAVVAQALEELDESKRLVFAMHELESVPIPEIARVLGIPLNTAYSRLRLARQEFPTVVRRIQSRGRTA